MSQSVAILALCLGSLTGVAAFQHVPRMPMQLRGRVTTPKMSVIMLPPSATAPGMYGPCKPTRGRNSGAMSRCPSALVLQPSCRCSVIRWYQCAGVAADGPPRIAALAADLPSVFAERLTGTYGALPHAHSTTHTVLLASGAMLFVCAGI